MEQRTTAGRPPHPLPAYGDRTVSRIHAKYEARDGMRAMEDVGAAVGREFSDAVRPYGKTGRPLPPSVVRDVSRSFVTAFARSGTVLHASDRHLPATRTRPRGESFSHHRIDAVAGDDGLVRLQSVHLFVTSKEASLDVSFLPLSWTLHAQERFHERTPARVRADVEVARSVLSAMGQLVTLCSRHGVPSRRVALPSGGGLLLGEYVGLDAAIGFRSVLDRHGTRTRGLASGWPCGWRAKTFVGPDEVGPDQREYARRWEALAHGFEAVTETCVEGLCRRDGRDPFRDVGDVRWDQGLVEDAVGCVSGLADLVGDPRMRRACGDRGDPVATAPSPPCGLAP